MACRMPVASIGYGRPESVPLFHVAPGGSIARLLLPARGDAPVRCPEWCGVLSDLSESVGSESPISMLFDEVMSASLRWGVDAILVEGVNVLLHGDLECFASKARQQGILFGVRLFGNPSLWLDKLNTITGIADFAVFDYLGGVSDSADLKLSSIRVLEALTRIRLHLEVIIYLDTPISEKVTPVIHAVNSTTPVHLIIRDPRGGGPAKQLYDQIRRKNPLTYLHAPPYDYLDTYCPRCGALVAVREDTILASLKAGANGSCWRCGYRLPFVGPLYERTPRRIVRRSGVGTVWLDPRVVAARSYYKDLT